MKDLKVRTEIIIIIKIQITQMKDLEVRTEIIIIKIRIFQITQMKVLIKIKTSFKRCNTFHRGEKIITSDYSYQSYIDLMFEEKKNV